MDKVQIIELGAGAGTIAFGTFLLLWLKKTKNKLRKKILRQGGQN